MFKFDQNIALANAGASALNSKGCEITKEQLNKDFKGGEVPDLLETAALNLMDLANQGFCDRWTHSSMGEDIVAQRAAVQLAQNALQIIADIVEESAAEQVAHLNHQLALIGSKLPNNASYNDQQT